MARMKFTFSNFLVRWLVALALVMATFNPSYSYTQWVMASFDGDTSGLIMAIQVLIGIGLFIGYVVFIRATMRSIGPIGAALVVILLLSLLWVLREMGLFQEQIRQTEFWIWIGLVVFATVLAVGLSWSHIRRRITGQYDMDDVSDGK